MMPLAIKPLPKKAAPRKPAGLKQAITPPAAPIKVDYDRLTPSSLKVFDIAVEDLVESESNPNEMDEQTFDLFVEKVKADGFDEPIQVVPMGEGGKFKITGGHHRTKAAKVLGMKAVPAVIKEGWDEDKQQMELVSRNALKGVINPVKFTELYDSLKKKGYDEALLKMQLGFTKEDAFKKLYKNISKSLPPAQRKKLDDAKETITSVDGLSSTLNSIFKEHGSDLDHNFCVFQYGGKKHHYIVMDKDLSKKLEAIEQEARDKGLDMTDVMNALLKNPNLAGVQPSAKIAERAEKRSK